MDYWFYFSLLVSVKALLILGILADQNKDFGSSFVLC